MLTAGAAGHTAAESFELLAGSRSALTDQIRLLGYAAALSANAESKPMLETANTLWTSDRLTVPESSRTRDRRRAAVVEAPPRRVRAGAAP